MKSVFVLLFLATVAPLTVYSALRVSSLNSVSPQVSNEVMDDVDGKEGDSLNYIESDDGNAAAEVNVAAAPPDHGPIYYVKDIADDDDVACINGWTTTTEWDRCCNSDYVTRGEVDTCLGSKNCARHGICIKKKKWSTRGWCFYPPDKKPRDRKTALWFRAFQEGEWGKFGSITSGLSLLLSIVTGGS